MREETKSLFSHILLEDLIKVKENISNKIEKESNKILDGSKYEECLKSKFATDLAEFARTYLHNEMYKLKKEVMENGDTKRS